MGMLMHKPTYRHIHTKIIINKIFVIDLDGKDRISSGSRGENVYGSMDT